LGIRQVKERKATPRLSQDEPLTKPSDKPRTSEPSALLFPLREAPSPGQHFYCSSLSGILGNAARHCARRRASAIIKERHPTRPLCRGGGGSARAAAAPASPSLGTTACQSRS